AEAGHGDDLLLWSDRAVTARKQLVERDPSVPEYRSGLADSWEQLGQSFLDLGHVQEAQWAWQHALDVRAHLATEQPGNPEVVRAWGDRLNDLAWLLANGPSPADRDPERALPLA